MKACIIEGLIAGFIINAIIHYAYCLKGAWFKWVKDSFVRWRVLRDLLMRP